MGTRRQLTTVAWSIALALLGAAAFGQSPQQREVGSSRELYAAVTAANRSGDMVISLRDGEYLLKKPLTISGNHIILRSASGERDRVILRGNGMRATKGVDNLLDISGQHVSLIGLTLQEAGNHLIQLRGERNADYFSLINCVLRDGYEQLLKVSAKDSAEPSADFGVVKDSLFEYSAELGPNYYIGGIDLHSGKEWLIAGNTFRNIASPGEQVAEQAIHIWKGSADNVVRDNLIVNSDRGIGFGLTKQWFRHNRGGEITGNIILHLRTTDPFSDVGIVVENSPDTVINNNFIYLAHGYPNAIEYRFPKTTGVVIGGNLTNKAIRSRDGAEAQLLDNQTASFAATAFDNLALAIEKIREKLAD